jgi:serine protease Do
MAFVFKLINLNVARRPAMVRHAHANKYIAVILSLILMGFTLSVFASRSAAATAPDTFADLAEKLGPTVVNVYTTQTVEVSSSPHQFFFPDDMEIPEPFRRFFGIPDQQQETPKRKMERTSLGSGVIATPDGYILTNNHVVEDADEINITLSTFEEYEAKVVGRDPKSDLALIKIEPERELPAVAFGNSDKLRVGDWVLAIGNPFGLQQTVTAGIISAKGRSINNGTYGNFIQTDASINPGNSGGPLFNLKGEMIGVNTAIFSRTGGNIGIGFAIPANMAKRVMQQLKEFGKVTRGWLGVMIQHVTPELADNFGLDRPIGALVGQVVPDSPADKAGIKAGDVIIEYNGKEVSQMSMLPAMVAQTPIDEKAAVVLIRDGNKKTIPVIIGKMAEEQALFDSGEGANGLDLGLTVQELSPELAESLGIEDVSGLIITNVDPGSAAAETGIKRGDIIQEINREPVASIADYKKSLMQAKNKKSILLLLKREQHTRFVVIKLK